MSSNPSTRAIATDDGLTARMSEAVPPGTPGFIRGMRAVEERLIRIVGPDISSEAYQSAIVGGQDTVLAGTEEADANQTVANVQEAGAGMTPPEPIRRGTPPAA